MQWRSPEHRDQHHLADFLGYALRPPTCWTSIDHAGKGAFERVSRALRGVKPGIEDIQIIHPHPGGGVIMLCLELKRRKTKRSGKGRQADEQRAWQAQREAAGAVYVVVESLEQAVAAIQAAGISTHATLIGSSGAFMRNPA